MRPRGWESRLAAYIREANGREFRWGQNDCALWACGWIEFVTGRDFAAGYRGRYRTEAGAFRALRRNGYASLRAIADANLDPIPPAIARRGDILLHANGSLGICDGYLGHFLAPSGVATVPTMDCVAAWRVG